MKRIYMINYDLNSPGQDYKDLINTIKGYGTYAKCLKSGWFVYTSETSTEVYNKLNPFLDTNDLIFISEVNANHMGYLNKDIVEWLKGFT